MICGHLHLWVGEWVSQWLGSCQITKYQINLDIIEIIQFCLKIYNMWTPSVMGGWMGGLMGKSMVGIMSDH